MKPEDTQSIMKKWFQSAGRTVTHEQLRRIFAVLKMCPLPLFLKLNFDLALKYAFLIISYSKTKCFKL